MKARTWALGAGATLVAVLLAGWAFAPRPLPVETAAVTQGRFEATVDEDARTRVRDRYVVSAPLAGLLQRIALREGDAVQAGDAVATLLPALPAMLDERTLREQQQRVEGAQANLQRADVRIERARVMLQQARNEMLRSETLAAQGFVSPTKLDNDRLSVQAAQKELDAAVEDRHVAEHDAAQARAALLAVRGLPAAGAGRGGEGGRAFVLNAPVQGRVLRVLQASEAAVAMGTPLLEIGDTARMEVVAELLTTDALKARPGSRVLIERWGGPGALEGRVRLVEPGAFTKVSALGVEEQRVRVLIDLVSPRERWQALGDAYRVAVRVVTQAADGAVQVPVGAVFPLPDGEGLMGVYRLDAGRLRLQPVAVAARNATHAWVTEGLRPGQEVVLYPPSDARDGARAVRRKVS